MGETDEEKRSEKWAKIRDAWMALSLGEEYESVMHAIIPFCMGGGLDLYFYTQGIPGTTVATKELSETPGEGPSNKVFKNYELVMFTRHGIDLKGGKNKKTVFEKTYMSFSRILNHTANFAFQATLNPNETAEFPKDFEHVGGKCLIFDEYGVHKNREFGSFGLLLVMEVFESEMKYAMKNGGKALFKILKKEGIYPYSDMDREAVV